MHEIEESSNLCKIVRFFLTTNSHIDGAIKPSIGVTPNTRIPLCHSGCSWWFPVGF